MGLLFSSVFSLQLLAAPFEQCPSDTFVIDEKSNAVHSLDLSTGSATLVKNHFNDAADLSGFAFSQGYVWSFDYKEQAIARFGRNFKLEYFSVANLPQRASFSTGAISGMTFFLYSKIDGLFSIDLSTLSSSPQSTDSLQAISIPISLTLEFHHLTANPVDSMIYGIEPDSNALYKISPQTGQHTYVRDLNIEDKFSSIYFDSDGFLYAININNKIYRFSTVELSNELTVNEVSNSFATAQAPTIANGARCSEAKLISDSNELDFGDAPNQYNTLLTSNGPRHKIDDVTYLGSTPPDSEKDARTGALRDDTHQSNDEDGVSFVTSIEPNSPALVNVIASTNSVLSAWFDWNQDGDFNDPGEQAFNDVQVKTGSQILTINVAKSALVGQTWGRFRISQQNGLNYSGGAASGEVEDHKIIVSSPGFTVRHFPNSNGFATLAYEDFWPYTSDFDMNDVVMNYRISELFKDGELVKTFISGRLAAMGADYRNGFAIRLPGIQRKNIDINNTYLFHNDKKLTINGLEEISEEAIFIIASDLTELVQSSCSFYRTDNNCKEDELFSFDLQVAIKPGTNTTAMKKVPYDPFIFATPGYYHGEGLPLHPGRQWEVHLPDYVPTEQFNEDAMWGLGDDGSSPTEGNYFKSTQNLPFALLILDEWQWPIERSNPVQAYPEFANYAESGGIDGEQWSSSVRANQLKIFR